MREEEKTTTEGEVELESEIESQLVEHRDSLAAVQQALSSDPDNPHLLPVYEELVLAIEAAEEGLFQLKRARLLREADYALQASKSIVEDIRVEEPLDEAGVGTAVQPEGQSYSVGSKCRFRHIDGHWYDGIIVALDGQSSAKISFLTPSSANKLICKFFLQDRCRFGASCRLSHGVDVPVSTLKMYIPTVCEQLLEGSSIWALPPHGKTGIWKEAKLQSWNDEIKTGKVFFQDNGSSAYIGREAISLSEYAQMSDEEDEEGSYPSSEQSDDTSECNEDNPQGLGFVEITAQQKGIQTETAIFAKWENHTRGIASKMMANMGYREGMGLGVLGQGIVDPISVKILPSKQSLDNAVRSQDIADNNNNNKGKGKKNQSRGGKRKRDKKFVEVARAAKEKMEVKSDVFSFINTQLAMKGKAQPDGVIDEQKKEDRRALVAYDDEVKELKMRVEKLEEIAARNKKEVIVYEGAMRKLNETRRALAEVEAAHTSASKALTNKEREKKWLKF